MFASAMAAPAASAASRVEKATSHLLLSPDWAVNLEICDTINTDLWQTKDVVKAVKKRLQNKDPKVQFFALTLLETMMKNCGEYVHSEVVEQNVLHEMVKIVQKKTDMQVRDKVLLLLDSWQEAFGGPGGKYPQYYWAYIELRRTGIMFPRRPVDASPIFTPPVTHHSPSYGSPRYAPGSLNERMASDIGNLSLGDLNNIRNVTELLNDMVNAVNPSDRTAVKDEIITDLVIQCRSNQQKLMQFVGSTGDEQLLKQGLEINDRLQMVLAKHDAIASGATLAAEAPRKDALEAPRKYPTPKPSAPPPPVEHNQVGDEEEDDEFAQLAQRKNKSAISSDLAESSNVSELALVPIDATISEASSSAASNALVPADPPVSSTRTKEQDMIDLLSITLYSPPTPETPTNSSGQIQNEPQQPTAPNGTTAPNGQQYPSSYQPYPPNQGYPSYNNFVAPWAQPAAYPAQPQPYPSSYPGAPWATPATVGPNPFTPPPYQVPNPPVVPVTPTTTYVPPITPQPMQRYNSFGYRGSNGPTMAPEAQISANPRQKESSAAASKPYYMPDNLFGDLIDLKSYGSGNKMSRSPSMPSPTGQPMIGGKK